MTEVRIQEQDFDPGTLQAELLAISPETGALATFTGVVRRNAQSSVQRMFLEHYPGMTERSIQGIVDAARQRWDLLGVRVIHRVGLLSVGEQIVYVGVTASHRGDAFAACEFVMDFLKTRAPFWKKEFTPDGEQWVEPRLADTEAANRW